MTKTFTVISRGICIWFAILLGVTECRAQDPHFSQYYANPIYTNPAFAGSSIVGRGVINYRSQWPGISGTFRTYSASYDEHYDIINGGLGFMVTNDEAGVGLLRTTSFSGIYAYQVQVTKKITIQAALQAGIFQKYVDFSKLTFRDMMDNGGIKWTTSEVPPSNAVNYYNVSAGFIVYSNNFYAGLAVHNINEPVASFFNGRFSDTGKEALTYVQKRYTGHAGLVIPITRSRDESKSSNLWPNIIYMTQGIATELNLGMYYNRGALVLGTYFRQNGGSNPDAVIVLAGFRLKKLRFGVSMDNTVSEARVGGAAKSYEVSLAFELRKREHKKTFRTIRCPEF